MFQVLFLLQQLALGLKEQVGFSNCALNSEFGLIQPSLISLNQNEKKLSVGMTDSICCSVDTPYSNCGTSGANDYIEMEGAREPPIFGFDVFRVGDGNR